MVDFAESGMASLRNGQYEFEEGCAEAVPGNFVGLTSGFLCGLVGGGLAGVRCGFVLDLCRKLSVMTRGVDVGSRNMEHTAGEIFAADVSHFGDG